MIGILSYALSAFAVGVCTTQQTEATSFAGCGDTAVDACVVCTPAQLVLLGEPGNADKFFRLGQDMDFGGMAFTPIGSTTGVAFSGQLDGGGHVLRHLVIRQLGVEIPVGLFSSLTCASTETRITNLSLFDIDVEGETDVGGLVGAVRETSCPVVIDRVGVSGVVSGTSRVGGVVGSTTSDGALENTFFSGTVGGVDQIGGLGGQLQGGVRRSFAAATVGGDGSVGGLAGSASSATLQQVFSLGRVTGRDGVGGLLGSSLCSVGTIALSEGFVSGSVVASGGLAGPIVGVSGACVTDTLVFWNSTSMSFVPDGVRDRTQSELQTADTFAGFDTAVWTLTGGQFPWFSGSSFVAPSDILLGVDNGNPTLGDNVTLTAVPTLGTPVFTFEWLRDGQLVVATETPTLTRVIGAEDLATWSVVVTNARGSATSNQVSLGTSTAPPATPGGDTFFPDNDMPVGEADEGCAAGPGSSLAVLVLLWRLGRRGSRSARSHEKSARTTRVV